VAAKFPPVQSRAGKTVARRKLKNHVIQNFAKSTPYIIPARIIQFGAYITVQYRTPQYRTPQYRTPQYCTQQRRVEATGVASEPQARPSVPYDPYGTLGG
jgi:hypothetical protein